MAVTPPKRRIVMNRDEDFELIELGTASEATRGGPWGVDDFRGSFMLPGLGLLDD